MSDDARSVKSAQKVVRKLIVGSAGVLAAGIYPHYISVRLENQVKISELGNGIFDSEDDPIEAFVNKNIKNSRYLDAHFQRDSCLRKKNCLIE